MDIMKTLITLMIFLIGFLSAAFASAYFDLSFENPVSLNRTGNNSSPSDFIEDDDILVYPDRIVILVSGASISKYAPTGSMLPLLDQGSNGIRIRPTTEENINVGDLITYKKDGKLIIHRVIEKGVDDLGIYFIPKGDNNNVSDGKIRFSDIEFVTVGLIY
jgi:hypothetical protein